MLHSSIIGLANDAQPDFAISRTSPSNQACFPLQFISRLFLRPKFSSLDRLQNLQPEPSRVFCGVTYLITLSFITPIAVTPLDIEDDTRVLQHSGDYLRR